MSEDKEALGIQRRKEYYTTKVSEYLNRFPNSFREFVGNEEIINFGDNILSNELSRGYNFAFPEQLPMPDKMGFIVYSNYKQRTGHFGEVLARMEADGIIGENDVALGVKASKILGEYQDPEVTVIGIEMRDGTYERGVESVDGLIVFWPKNELQAVAIARFLLEKVSGMKDAFIDPDIRASVDLAPLIEEIGFRRAVANIFYFEEGNIITLRQKSRIERKGWAKSPLLLNEKLYEYLVSSRVGP